GDETWGYAHVRDIYKRIEDWHGAPDPAYRGTGGNVFVQPAPDPSPLAPAFLKALERMGVATFPNQNGRLQESAQGGGALTDVRIRDGRRRNIPADYLYPVMDQPNLTVLTGAFVRRLTFAGKSVTGVELEWQGATREIRASSEVVLSAGALETPK